MKHLIEPYLKAHESAWAPSTLKSESSRLRALAPLLRHEPGEVFRLLTQQGKAPYTIKTSFIRLVDLERWAKLEPRYVLFMEEHVRRFRCVYEKEEVKVTFEDAYARIATLKGRARVHALGLLESGLRISESYNIHDGKVRGKGGKTRKVYGKIEETTSKSSLTRALRSIGLKPHTLRKLCATNLAENGATPADLCKVFGWSSIETAYQYLQPREEAKLESLMAKAKARS